MIASGSDDYTVKLWDVASGKEITTLKGHGGPVDSVAISPDGRMIASGGWDDTVKLWDLGEYLDLLKSYREQNSDSSAVGQTNENE